MKQFNLEEYLKNPQRKVVTRNGNDVRIICTDRKNLVNDIDFDIIALVSNKEKNYEICYAYNKNGQCHNNNNILDLFFAPIKKEGWVNVYKNNFGGFTARNIFKTKKEAEKYKTENCIATSKVEWEEE